ncbi:RNA polymerase sigma factor [Amycolatopsis sp. cmx-8-4]|uniref:RNA polymerase sigma factor n=1 Tax=Amycolatopsis sp. cmx-8-4 TaxID=2790947 RepID=UPI00397A7AB3
MTAAPVLGTELFTEVHDRHFAAIYRYVAGRLGAQAAEDVAAETFLVAFDRRAKATPPAATCGPGCSASRRTSSRGTAARRPGTTGRSRGSKRPGPPRATKTASP